MTRLPLALLLVACACGGDDESGPRYRSLEDGVSFAKLPSWTVTRERGTLLLESPEHSGTIAVRSIPRDGWSEPRTADNVFPAVETALRALPRARVSPAEVEGAGYRAVAFEVEFAPPTRPGRRYQRRHVALLADTRVIHVFLVAPRGQLESSRRAFDTIVRTIREEG